MIKHFLLTSARRFLILVPFWRVVELWQALWTQRTWRVNNCPLWPIKRTHQQHCLDWGRSMIRTAHCYSVYMLFLDTAPHRHTLCILKSINVLAFTTDDINIMFRRTTLIFTRYQFTPPPTGAHRCVTNVVFTHVIERWTARATLSSWSPYSTLRQVATKYCRITTYLHDSIWSKGHKQRQWRGHKPSWGNQKTCHICHMLSWMRIFIASHNF